MMVMLLQHFHSNTSDLSLEVHEGDLASEIPE